MERNKMTEPASPDKFVAVVKELLASKGLELPQIPESPGRRAYLSFISSMGYREEELLPVFDTSKRTPEMTGAMLFGLMEALKRDDLEFLKYMCWMAVNTMTGR